MSRKKAHEATLQAQRAQEARWRYLLRNPNFRKDLRDLSRLQGDLQHTENFFKLSEEIQDRWGLLWIPGEAIRRSFYLESPEDSFDLERFGAEWGVAYSPVAVTELRKNRFLFLRADLQHPVEDLLPLIEKELREATQGRHQRRRRLDTVDFYLRVFDLAVNGDTFSQIAKKLKRRPSTIKSAYLAASRNIFGPAEKPRKKTLPLVDFDPSTHMERCPTCQEAQAPEEFCSPARLYACQDTKAQREVIGHDTNR